MRPIVFTSIAKNYLPKAVVLSNSLKESHPSIRLVVVQVDAHLEKKPHPLTQQLDQVLTLKDLWPGSPRQLDSWTFKHDLMELCTAVKGLAFQYLFRTTRAPSILYLDPDVLVVNPLDEVFADLERHSILLTPHLLKPEKTLANVAMHECGVLRNGIYNLGFLGVKRSEEGLRFVDWWSERLLSLCYRDWARGLFTDQKWADLIPVFFRDFKVMTDPGLNVARWNVGQRKVSFDKKGRFFVEGEPLKFMHFSAFDSGEHDSMTASCDRGNQAIQMLNTLYRSLLHMNGGEDPTLKESPLDRFSNGTRVSDLQRQLYRHRDDLIKAFPHPLLVTYDEPCFLHWYKEDLRNGLKKRLSAFRPGAQRGALEDFESFLSLS